jgi:hypothetical protein
MYCIHCGAKLEGEPKFCYKCGQPLAEVGKPARPKPPPAVVPTAAPPPKRKARRRWPLTCGIVILALMMIVGAAAAGAYLWFGLHRTNQVAKIVPAQTSAFISISPSPLHLLQLRHADNLTKGAAIFVGLPGVLEWGGAVQKNLPLDFDVDPKKEILPWIGGEVSLAIVDGDIGTDRPALILAAATRNQDASDAFLEKLRTQMEREGFAFGETDYRGTRITEIESPRDVPLAYTTIDHLVVIATDSDVLHESIDAASGDRIPVLHDQEPFQNMLQALPTSRLGYAYLDWSALPEEAWEDMADIELPLGSLQAIESVGVALALARDGLCFDYAVNYDLDALAPEQEEFLQRPAWSSRLADLPPVDSLAYISGRNLFGMWEGIFTDSELQDIIEEVEHETGVHLVQDFLDLLRGEYAWVAVPDPAGLFGSEEVPLGLLLFIEVEDRARVELSLKDLVGELVQGGDDLQEDEFDGVPVWLLEDPYNDITLGYGFVEGFLFIGTSRDVIRLAAEMGDSPLADSKLFQTAVKPLPGHNHGYVYVDVQQSVRTFNQTLDDYDKEEFNATIRPYIESIRAISMATEPMDENGVLHGVLFVHTE